MKNLYFPAKFSLGLTIFSIHAEEKRCCCYFESGIYLSCVILKIIFQEEKKNERVMEPFRFK